MTIALLILIFFGGVVMGIGVGNYLGERGTIASLNTLTDEQLIKMVRGFYTRWK